MPKGKNSAHFLLDDDVAFYRKNAFLVRAISDMAGTTINNEQEGSGVKLLQSIIQDHKRSLVIRLSEEPLSEISSMIQDAKKAAADREGVSLEKSPFYFRHYLPANHDFEFKNDYASERMAIYHIHRDYNDVWIEYKDCPGKIDILKNNYDRYTPLAAGLLLTKWLDESPDKEQLPALLLCFAALIKLDQMKLYELFRSEKYEDYAASKKGKRHSDKQTDSRRPLENQLIEMAVDLWMNKNDQRWHHKMAKHLTSIINGPVVQRIKDELAEKFPLHKSNDKDSALFNRELDKRIKYETISFDRAKSLLLKPARDANRAREPKKKQLNLNSNANDFDNIYHPEYD